MDRRLCWLALCWWLGGCPIDDEPNNLAIELQQTIFQSQQSEAQYYNTRWDKVDVKQMLSNRRLIKMYFNCLVSRGPCTPDGREIKRALPEALENACAKCTKSQIDAAVKIIHYLREFEPAKFEILAKKYDPRGIYRKKYLDITSDDFNNSLNERTNESQRRRRLIKRHIPEHIPRSR
ncbi:hypothetical protein QAD02_001676 [Eretmocerus hayati]|uniref:Uncharacterized protein n=1 Tax=Eretmocerus hayati TaxID=131215 RepID=A0ACC2NH42_9HYME|nr:hypothetical protein QAD02_001676 [Eretmocerus hayati]